MSIDMSLGPAIRGALKNTQKGTNDSDNPDWQNLLQAWVRQRSYYPPQAARDNEEGDSTVHVVADHFGHVKSVELVRRSGSVWLDMALVALFRDAHIPPLPTPGDDPIDLTFTIHYILIRPPGY